MAIRRAALSDAKGGIPQEDEREEKIERGEDSITSLVPFEIFQLIFHLYCQSRKYLGLYTEEPIDTLPVFTLMQVCSAWRQIVLNTPNLWSVVSTNDRRRHLALARRWLSRAGNIPRTLSIALQHDSLTAVYYLISQYPFRALSLTVYCKSRCVDFSKIRVESLLPLERLELFRRRGGPCIGMALSPHTFPNLSWLRLYGSFELQSFKTIPWPSLRQLDLDCAKPLSLSESLTILRDATALERAKMVVLVGAQLPSAWRIVAANLSALHVSFGGSRIVGHFLDMLTAPKLKTLKLENEYLDVMECDTSAIQRLVASSGIEMEELSIFRTAMPLSVGALLDCMPSLQRLELHTNSILDEDSMKKIANGELGPRLEVLAIHLRLVSPKAAAPILRMIESRQNLARSETHSYFKKVRIWVVRMEFGYTLRDYVERLEGFKGIVEFR